MILTRHLARPENRSLIPFHISMCRHACLILLSLLVGSKIASAQEQTFPRRHSTSRRLRLYQLRATHDAVAKLRETYRPLTPPHGYIDLRAVIHAHTRLSYDSRGTIAGVVKAAKESGVKVIMTTEHPTTQHDVLAKGFRGMRDGILFIPGTEEENLLTFPTRRVRSRRGQYQLVHDARPLSRQQRINLISAQPNGLVFVAHPEEIEDSSLRGFHGMEIYNTHADLKDEPELQELLSRDLEIGIVTRLWQAFKLFPNESFACIMDPQKQVLNTWDTLTQKRRIVGIAANDSHENNRFIITKMSNTKVDIRDYDGNVRGTFDVSRVPPSFLIRGLLRRKKAGDHLMTLTLDPYERSFHYVSTHIIARKQTEPAVRAALAAGHCYVCFDWIGDPTGTYLTVKNGRRSAMMGDSIEFRPNTALEFGTTLEVTYRILRNGELVYTGSGRRDRIPLDRPGVYRVECYVSIAGEDRPWLYTNPIYVS